MKAATDPLRNIEPEIADELAGDGSVITQNSLNSHSRWPDPLPEEAYYGLAGELVALMEPQSESDPAAILAQLLAAFANAVGRGPHFRVEADEHHLNLFVGIVGRTSKGRKGTAWGRVRRTVASTDPVWAESRIMDGLSSGEGLIWAVRDPIEKHEAIRERSRGVGYQTVIADPGVTDKRLLVVQPELASTLRVLQRDRNTLSATLRQAWDSGDLRVLTKNSPAKATGAFISLIGHITRDELRWYLDRTEIANGLANRFIWICAKRSKYLPEGGCLSEFDLKPLEDKLKAAVQFARTVGEMARDDDARAAWCKVYPALSEERSGMLGAITSRSEAQVTRLSSIYALLDHSNIVRHEHLTSALALWSYSEASARFIFGDATGDPTADIILKALREQSFGLSRTDISSLFDRHRSTSEIQRALDSLIETGMAHCTKEQTSGRPTERYFAL